MFILAYFCLSAPTSVPDTCCLTVMTGFLFHNTDVTERRIQLKLTREHSQWGITGIYILPRLVS